MEEKDGIDLLKSTDGLKKKKNKDSGKSLSWGVNGS